MSNQSDPIPHGGKMRTLIVMSSFAFCGVADLALDAALSLAEKFAASVTLVHVSWIPPDLGFGANIRCT